MRKYQRYVLAQTLIGVAMSAGFGALAFSLNFQGQASVLVWGWSGLVFDCVIQGFMIGLMTVLLPGLAVLFDMRRGKLAVESGDKRPIRVLTLIARALSSGLVSASVLTLSAAATATITGTTTLPFIVAFAMKALANCVIPLVTTPVSLRCVLTERNFDEIQGGEIGA